MIFLHDSFNYFANKNIKIKQSKDL